MHSIRLQIEGAPADASRELLAETVDTLEVAVTERHSKALQALDEEDYQAVLPDV